MGVLYGAEFLAVVCFVIAFQRFGVADAARRAIRAGLDAGRVLSDPALSDREKEQAARKTSFVLLGDFASIAARSAAALAVSSLPVIVLHVTGVADIAAVNSLMLSWNGIVFATVVAVAIYLAATRMQAGRESPTGHGQVQSSTEK